MAETPALEPRAAVAAGTRPLVDDVELTITPPRACVRLQLAPSALADAGSITVAGVDLPIAPGTRRGDDPAALWLAPNGWLWMSRRSDGAALARAVAAACAGRAHAAVDVSDSLVVLELRGTGARALLARESGVDATVAGFVAGRCARTRLAQLAAILHPLEDGAVEVIVDRAAAAWLVERLAEAARAAVGLHAGPR